MTTPRAAFEIVDRFEAAVGGYTGAPHVVAVDSCTNAIFLALLWARRRFDGYHLEPRATLPRRTYVGVAQAALNAGYWIRWRDVEWRGVYQIGDTPVWDAAKRFTGGMFTAGVFPLHAIPYRGAHGGALVCVSFQAGKILPIGRGGAILTDSAEAAAWLRRARFDGRGEGEDTSITTPGWHMYLDPPSAARGLWLMTYLAKDNPDQVDEYDDLSTLEAFR